MQWVNLWIPPVSSLMGLSSVPSQKVILHLVGIPSCLCKPHHPLQLGDSGGDRRRGALVSAFGGQFPTQGISQEECHKAPASWDAAGLRGGQMHLISPLGARHSCKHRTLLLRRPAAAEHPCPRCPRRPCTGPSPRCTPRQADLTEVWAEPFEGGPALPSEGEGGPEARPG